MPLRPIDLDEGAELAGNNPQAAQELLGVLVTNFSTELPLIRDAYQNNDYILLSQLIHKFYGGLCYCGVPDLRETTKVLYRAIVGIGKAEAIEKAYSNFESAIERVEFEYKKITID